MFCAGTTNRAADGPEVGPVSSSVHSEQSLDRAEPGQPDLAAVLGEGPPHGPDHSTGSHHSQRPQDRELRKIWTWWGSGDRLAGHLVQKATRYPTKFGS